MLGGKGSGKALARLEAYRGQPAGSGYLGSRSSCGSFVKCPDEAPALTRLPHGVQRHLGKGGAAWPGMTSAGKPELCLLRMRSSSRRLLADLAAGHVSCVCRPGAACSEVALGFSVFPTDFLFVPTTWGRLCPLRRKLLLFRHRNKGNHPP